MRGTSHRFVVFFFFIVHGPSDDIDNLIRCILEMSCTAMGLLSFLFCVALQAAKNPAALAAAKARFEQQQKENDEIAERNKRQRLGLPEPRPAVPEVFCC